jgi:hypothetical protein
MNRLQVLAGNPRRTLGALAVVVAAVGITAGSGASFTASSANAANKFTAGTLSIGNDQAGAVLTASNLIPGGGVQDGYVAIENTGSMKGDFTLKQTVTGDTDAMGKYVHLTIRDCGAYASGSTTAPVCGDADDRMVHSGTVNATTDGFNAPVTIPGSFAAGEKHYFKFSVSLDSQAPNSVQAALTQVDYTWTAVQA